MIRRVVEFVTIAQRVNRIGKIDILETRHGLRRGRQVRLQPDRNRVIVDLAFVDDGVGGAPRRIRGGEEIAFPEAHQRAGIADRQSAETDAPAGHRDGAVLRAVAGRLRPLDRPCRLELAEIGLPRRLQPEIGRRRIGNAAGRHRAVLVDEQRQAAGRRLALLIGVGRPAGQLGATTGQVELHALVVVIIIVVIVRLGRLLVLLLVVFVGGLLAGRWRVLLGRLGRSDGRAARPKRGQSQHHPPQRHRRPRT